jgi:hypothetical protein
MTQFKMSKKQAHILISFFDLFCIGNIWLFYDDTSKLFFDIHNQVEMVTFSSKEGFFILAIGMPIIHLLVIIEHYYFGFIKRHAKAIGYGFIAMLLILFLSAIVISSLIKTKVENEGYINCHELNRSSTYSIFYAYTRNQAICEQLLAEKAKEK